jgi:hypothetical protein
MIQRESFPPLDAVCFSSMICWSQTASDCLNPKPDMHQPLVKPGPMSCAAHRPSSWRRSLAAAILWPLPALLALATIAQPVYLSDRRELILSSAQDWGVLGFDTAAHAPGKEGSPLQIGETPFAKGLGHHANGFISSLSRPMAIRELRCGDWSSTWRWWQRGFSHHCGGDAAVR